ncbi:MAG: FG-GAP repeat protein [Flavobacteriales bacterium]|nr:FG-GAP repeat protein [Flavobacteriales bacterium]
MKHLITALLGLFGSSIMLGASDTTAGIKPEGLLLRDGTARFVAWSPLSDLTATILPGDLILRGPIAAPVWETRLTMLGSGRQGVLSTPWTTAEPCATDSTITWTGTGADIEYHLLPEGLRQDFRIHYRQPGSGPLEVSLVLGTDLCPVIHDTDIDFLDQEGGFVHAYRGLKVWDACGRSLNAWFEWNEGTRMLRINVEDGEATYPITVDPVSTTVNRALGFLGVNKFGRCVSSAGDLNGDGYSDVVVGAPADNSGGTTLPGAAYVYYGSSTGIAAAPDVTLTSGLAGVADNFGLGVDGAGDVNGDGYDDLIVGASTWNDNVGTPTEGGVFVYHGSATGISATPDYILQNNTNSSYMGSSVAGLGDINGDGFSDIAAGGWLAAYPSTSEGAVWVFLGSATGLNTAFRHRLEQNFGSAQFGFAVAGAGDVNGDGYNDMVVGAHKIRIPVGAPSVTGGIYVYRGSANAFGAGLNPGASQAFATTAYSTRNGWSVSSAGDVNGDGYSDVIIGDWQDNIGSETYEGVAMVFHGSATGLSTVPATIVEGGTANLYMGMSVGTAGDVNGDGYADVLIGCSLWANGQSNEGAAFLHLGSPTGISSSAFIRYEPNVANSNMGEWVGTAGDVNGDGYSDMIIGAPGAAGGRAYIYHGGTYNVSTTPTLTRASGAANAQLGRSVANAGDVNGDGYSDLIVGAPNAANGQAGEGLAYIHYGSITGPSAGPSLILEANIAGAAFGQSVASAGDVNGDGYADVVIGAPQANGVGNAYIYHGSAAGLSTVPALTLSGTSGSQFGYSVFKAGDNNADGYSDVLVGAPGNDQVFVYQGSATGLVATPVIYNAPFPGSRFGAAVGTAGDVNGDGFSDAIIGAPDLSNGQALEGAFYVYLGALLNLPTNPLTSAESNSAGRRLGTSVAGIGDVNGDGYFDVAAGGPGFTSPEANEGYVQIYYGAVTGFLGSGIIQSNSAGALMGTSVAEAGDVNGDGYADMIVGAPGQSNGEAGEGLAYVYLGGLTGISAANFQALEMNSAGEAFGTAVAGGGDHDGDGYSDVIVGSPNASPTLANEGMFRTYRGNNGLAYNRLTRQYMVDLTFPLATNSQDPDDHYYFGIGHRARSHIQRTPARLQWEVVHEGQPYSGNPITNSVSATGFSAAYTDLGLAGVQIKEVVPKIPGFYRNKWRVRVEYPRHKSIDGQRFSRWFYGYASAVGDIGVLPIELVNIEGTPLSEGNLIDWATASEQNSSHFIVERGTDGTDFTPVGSVEASGNSMATRTYEFLDHDPPAGLAYYRLRMVDLDMTEELSPMVAVQRNDREAFIYPVPVDDALFWSPLDRPVNRVAVLDALGRVAMEAATTGDRLIGRPLQQLATGTYTVLLYDELGVMMARSRFIKR